MTNCHVHSPIISYRDLFSPKEKVSQDFPSIYDCILNILLVMKLCEYYLVTEYYRIQNAISRLRTE